MALTGWTTRGLKVMADVFFRGATPPTDLYVALVTAATAPTVDTTTLSGLTELAAGNGYTAGGVALHRDSTDWDTLTQDDAQDEAFARAKDISWTATGGAIPASGSGARYAVLTDDHATVGSREVYAWWDLGGLTTISEDTTLALADLEGAIKHTELVYLFLARFDTAQAAPISSPLTVEVGEITVTDTGNDLSIADGEAVAADSGSWTPRLTASSVHVRAAGLTTVFEVTMPSTTNDLRLALDDTTSGNYSKNGIALAPGQQRLVDDLSGAEIRGFYRFDALTTGAYYRVAICLRAAGAFFLIKGGTEYPEWTLLMVTTHDTTSPVHEVVVWRSAGGSRIASIETAQLSGALATAYGLATARIASNVAGDTLTAEADALIEWTFEAVNAQTHSLEYRRTDADNLWRVDCDVLTQLIRLVRREGAVETVIDEVTVALTAGSTYRLVVQCSGTVHRAWIATSGGPNVDASSTFNQTATGVRAGGAGSDLIAWPYEVPVAVASHLDALTPTGGGGGGGGEEPPTPPEGVWTPEDWEERLLNDSYDYDATRTIFERDHEELYLPFSNSNDSDNHYDLGYGMDGLVALYQATGHLIYLQRAVSYIYNVVATAQLSSSFPLSQFKDSYLGWVTQNSAVPGLEVPLYEGVFWRYASRCLRVIHDTTAIHSQIYDGSTTYLQAYNTLFTFLTTHVFGKWRSRGMNHLFGARTHMAAHWAYIALEIWLCTDDATLRAQALEVFTKYNTDLSPYYSSSMRGQLFAHPLDPLAYAWNGVWGRYTLPGSADVGDDWSHHQMTISFLVESHRMGVYWTLDDMTRFVRLLKNVLWNGSFTTPQFYAYLKPENMTGRVFQSDGGIKLAAYDPTGDLLRVYQNYRTYVLHWTQLFGNGALSAKILLEGS